MFGGHDSRQGERDDVGDEPDDERVGEDQLQQLKVTHRDVGGRHPVEHFFYLEQSQILTPRFSG